MSCAINALLKFQTFLHDVETYDTAHEEDLRTSEVRAGGHSI